MAHPMNQFRQHNVARSRVGDLVSQYKRGGAAKRHHGEHHSDEAADKRLIHKEVMAMAHEGKLAKHRADRPHRAKGGRVHKKPTTVVNVITGHGAPPPAPPAMPPVAAMPPRPPMAPPPGPPPGGPPPGLAGAGLPPGGPPPGGMPMRARGGGVKSKGMNVGTKVQHDKAKAVDIKNMNRGRVVTFNTGGGVVSFKASGGKVPMPKPRPEGREPQPSDLYSSDQQKQLEGRRKGGCVMSRATGGGVAVPAKSHMGPKFHGGAGGGKGRLAKAARAERNYHGPD